MGSSPGWMGGSYFSSERMYGSRLEVTRVETMQEGNNAMMLKNSNNLARQRDVQISTDGPLSQASNGVGKEHGLAR